MKKYFLIFIIFITIINCSKENNLDSNITKNSPEPIISGSVQNGLRSITLDEAKSGKLSFFRGDYVIVTHQEEDTLLLIIDSLGVTKKYPAPIGEKPYFKVKKTGTFSYIIGDSKGTLSVSEYSQAQYQAVNAENAKKLIENLDPLILDVRTQYEYDMGHLKNTQLLPVQIIQKNFTNLIQYKDKPILIYCASGNRSTVASKVLIDNGFQRIYNMRYGIKEWYQKGYEIEK